MDASTKAVRFDETDEEPTQQRAFFDVQIISDRVVMRARHDCDPLEHVPSAGSQMDCVPAAVGGVASAFEQTAVFEVVHERHETARMHAELVGDLLLTAARTPSDRAQQSSLGRTQAQLGDARGELRRRERAELRQQERGALRVRVG
ncbi:MAG TPA: hypothetical protein VK923_04235 [Euzebyales bacterium]|nr:hypothetical protein [Euzebyales bacterium]